MAMRILPMLTTITTAIALTACAGSPYSPPATVTQIASRVAVPPSTPQRRSASVPIEYYDGQPLVRISFPGRGSFRCVLDTGASNLAIPYHAMQTLASWGLTDNEVVVLGAGKAELAGGGTIRQVNIRFAEIDIGAWRMKNVSASVIPDGDCLLGMSVLTRFGHPTIDFATKQLILAD